MKNFILIILVSATLFAQSNKGDFSENVPLSNPKVYASLGDTIYNNIENIENLQKIESYDHLALKIHKHIIEAQELKKLGFEIESGNKPEKTSEYLDRLRKLSKVNDYFIRSANSSFDSSIQNEDNKLFLDIVNSGMIDTKKNKKKILSYYNDHSDDIDSSGVIQNMIDEENAKKLKRKSYYKSKKQLEEERIKRIRENDKYKQEMLEKKLQKELELKKEQIRKEQERELFN